MAERRHAADREARRRAHRVRVRALEAERLRVDLPVPRAEHDHDLVPPPKDERLDDLADVAADRGRRLDGGTRRVRQNLHVDVEPAPA